MNQCMSHLNMRAGVADRLLTGRCGLVSIRTAVSPLASPKPRDSADEMTDEMASRPYVMDMMPPGRHGVPNAKS